MSKWFVIVGNYFSRELFNWLLEGVAAYHRLAYNIDLPNSGCVAEPSSGPNIQICAATLSSYCIVHTPSLGQSLILHLMDREFNESLSELSFPWFIYFYFVVATIISLLPLIYDTSHTSSYYFPIRSTPMNFYTCNAPFSCRHSTIVSCKIIDYLQKLNTKVIFSENSQEFVYNLMNSELKESIKSLHLIYILQTKDIC